MPPPGDDRRLAETVARIFARPLDRSRPLWELYLIHGPGRRARGAADQGAPLDGRRRLGQRDPRRAARPEPRRAARSRPRPEEPHGERVPGDLEMLGRGLLGAAAPAAARAALAADRGAEPDRAARRQRVPGGAAHLRRGLAAAARGRRRRGPRHPRGHDRARSEDELQRARSRRTAASRSARSRSTASSGSRTSSGSPSTTSSWRCARPRCATGCSTATSCRRSRWWR